MRWCFANGDMTRAHNLREIRTKLCLTFLLGERRARVPAQVELSLDVALVIDTRVQTELREKDEQASEQAANTGRVLFLMV